MDGRVRATAITSLIATLCLAFSVNAFAQGGTATVAGTVYDNVGVVPGATVTATMPAAGLVRTQTTSEVGLFRFSALPP